MAERRTDQRGEIPEFVFQNPFCSVELFFLFLEFGTGPDIPHPLVLSINLRSARLNWFHTVPPTTLSRSDECKTKNKGVFRRYYMAQTTDVTHIAV